MAARYPAERVVECGARNVNGTVRDCWPDATWTGIDIMAGDGVDVVSDFREFWPAVAPDMVVCCEVLEHVEDWTGIVYHALQILKPDGILVVTCASTGRAPHSAVDGGNLRAGEWYENRPPFLLLGARRLVEETPESDLHVVFQKG